MTLETFAVLAARLRTLDPFFDAPMAENYYESLHDIPESVAHLMCRGVLKRFDKRPAPKTLIDWARDLAPVRTFSVADLDAPRLKALPVPDGDARRIMAELRARLAREQETVVTPPTDPADAGDWGVEYDDGAGTVQRMPARWSEAKARALAAEKAVKYPHLSVGVYRAKKTAGVVAEVAGPAPKKAKVTA